MLDHPFESLVIFVLILLARIAWEIAEITSFSGRARNCSRSLQRGDKFDIKEFGHSVIDGSLVNGSTYDCCGCYIGRPKG
jgi:hypothetical protein